MIVMQVVPYLVVEGTVVGFRVVEIAAQEPEEYETASGAKKMTRGRAASSFVEVGINCPSILDGELDADLMSVLSVRWLTDGTAPPVKGEVVRWAVQAEQMKVFMFGRFNDWIAYHYRGIAPPAPVALAGPIGAQIGRDKALASV